MRQKGITLIEMLIVLAILSTVMGIIGAFFKQQTYLANRTQARNEVQDKTRTVMQLVSQDLQTAGVRTYADVYNNDASNDTYQLDNPLSLTDNYTATVSNSAGDSAWARDDLEVQYLTSTRSSSPCRHVTYYFDLTTLYRYDYSDASANLVCGTSNSTSGRGYSGDDDHGYGEGRGDHDEGDNHNGTGNGSPIANGILALDIMFRCTDGNLIRSTTSTEATCATGYSVRSAKILVTAQSDRLVYGYQGPSYAAYLNNSSGNSRGNPVSHVCPANHYCYSLEQEVSISNVTISTVPGIGNDGAGGGYGHGEHGEHND